MINASQLNKCVYVCVFYREPREFAGQKDECISCHPECQSQDSGQSCTGPVHNLLFLLVMLHEMKTWFITENFVVGKSIIFSDYPFHFILLM